MTKEEQDKIKYLYNRLMYSALGIHQETGIAYEKIRYFINYKFDYDKAMEEYLKNKK